MHDTVHPEADFGKLDWTKLKPDECTRNWSFGYGGYGLPDEKMVITVVEKGTLDADIWVVPDAFRAIVRTVEEIARRCVQDAVKTALGIK